DGGGIGRRDDGAKKQAGQKANSSGELQPIADEDRADHHRYDREEHHMPDIFEDVTDIDGKAGRKEQRRQEYIDEGIVEQSYLAQAADDIGANTGDPKLGIVEQPDENSEVSKHQGVREHQPAGGWSSDADGAEQSRYAEDAEHDRMHSESPHAARAAEKTVD